MHVYSYYFVSVRDFYLIRKILEQSNVLNDIWQLKNS